MTVLKKKLIQACFKKKINDWTGLEIDSRVEYVADAYTYLFFI